MQPSVMQLSIMQPSTCKLDASLILPPAGTTKTKQCADPSAMGQALRYTIRRSSAGASAAQRPLGGCIRPSRQGQATPPHCSYCRGACWQPSECLGHSTSHFRWSAGTARHAACTAGSAWLRPGAGARSCAAAIHATSERAAAAGCAGAACPASTAQFAPMAAARRSAHPGCTGAVTGSASSNAGLPSTKPSSESPGIKPRAAASP